MARLIFYRESASKSYRQLPFALSMVIAEMPYSLLCAVGFFLPIYYMFVSSAYHPPRVCSLTPRRPGLNPASSRAGLNFLYVLITELFSVTLGQAISALTPSTFIAMLLNPFIIINFALFCGVAVPKPQIPGFWRVWLYELVPYVSLPRMKPQSHSADGKP